MTSPLSSVPGWEQFKNLVAKFWWAGLAILALVLLAVVGGFWWKFVAKDSRESIAEVRPGLLHEICWEPNAGGIRKSDDELDTASLKDPEEEDEPGAQNPGDIPLQEIVVDPSNPNPGIPSIALQPPTPTQPRNERMNPIDPSYLSPNVKRKQRMQRARRSSSAGSSSSGSGSGSSGASGSGPRQASSRGASSGGPTSGSSGRSSSRQIARTPGALRRTIEKRGPPSTSGKNPKIYRGKSANITDWPFVVAVGAHRWPDNWINPLARTARRRQPKTLCTGIIIAPTWAITAGHCVKHFTSRNYVTGGTECRPEFGGIRDPRVRRVRVSRVERHFIKGLTISFKHWLPKWESVGPKPVLRKYQSTDVALLKLDEPIYEEGSGNPHIGSIQLEPISGMDFGQVTLQVAGWGATRYTNQVERLKEYTVPWRNVPGEAVLTSPEREADQRFFDSLKPYWDTQCLNGSPLVCIKTAPDESQTARGDSGAPLIGINPQTGEKTLLGTVTGGGAIFPLTPNEIRDRRSGGRRGRKVEENEPLIVPVPAGKLFRPGVGDSDVLVFVRAKDKRAWIHGVINGIPFGSRLWNGISLIGRCLWHVCIGWLLDFIETVILVARIVMRED